MLKRTIKLRLNKTRKFLQQNKIYAVIVVLV